MIEETMAKRLVSVEHDHWNVPEGTVLAPLRRRAGAFFLDVIAVTGLLSIVSRWRILDAWNISLWTSAQFHHAAALAFVLLASHFLYWTWTGRRLSRSLGQRWFGLAVVADDGAPLPENAWDSRALRKILYLVPIINILLLVRDSLRIKQRHTHQSEIDLVVGSIVAFEDSLPAETRRTLG